MSSIQENVAVKLPDGTTGVVIGRDVSGSKWEVSRIDGNQYTTAWFDEQQLELAAVEPPDRNWSVKDSGHRRVFKSGAQRDRASGKGRPVLLSPFAYMRIAKIAEQGAVKYDVRNWELGMSLGEFIDSAERHLMQLKMGEVDEDHAAQCAWNIMGYMHVEEMLQRGLLESSWDNMPKYVQLHTPEELRQRLTTKEEGQ